MLLLAYCGFYPDRAEELQLTGLCSPLFLALEQLQLEVGVPSCYSQPRCGLSALLSLMHHGGGSIARTQKQVPGSRDPGQVC